MIDQLIFFAVNTGKYALRRLGLCCAHLCIRNRSFDSVSESSAHVTLPEHVLTLLQSGESPRFGTGASNRIQPTSHFVPLTEPGRLSDCPLAISLTLQSRPSVTKVRSATPQSFRFVTLTHYDPSLCQFAARGVRHTSTSLA